MNKGQKVLAGILGLVAVELLPVSVVATRAIVGGIEVTYEVDDEELDELEYGEESGVVFVPEELYRTEGLRHKISALLNGTSEKHPHECEITIGESDACGLSSLELPTVIACFEMEGDGTIWFMIDGEDDWTDFDDMELEDLEKIYNELSNE